MAEIQKLSRENVHHLEVKSPCAAEAREEEAEERCCAVHVARRPTCLSQNARAEMSTHQSHRAGERGEKARDARPAR